jgi:hypothetical protein
VGQEFVEKSAMGANEGLGDGLLPIHPHAGGAGGLPAQATTMELVAGAVVALERLPVDLDPGGFVGEGFHRRILGNALGYSA